MIVFKNFEPWVAPFPKDEGTRWPPSLARFLWECARGARGALLALTLCTALLGVMEASLYRLLAKIVDGLAAAGRAGHEEHALTAALLWLGAILAGSALLVALQAGVKYQVITGNLVARVRWRFHRTVLTTPLALLSADLAGRLAATVMQCAVAVRIVWVIVADIIVFVAIYFATLSTLASAMSPVLAAPFLVWIALYSLSLYFFVPRLARVGARQAGMRAQVTGVVADAYTHATTLRLFSTIDQEMRQARASMRRLQRQSRMQLRLISGFEVVNQVLSVLLVAGTATLGVWLWRHGLAGAGAVAATCATAMRLHGIAHFVMGQMLLLVENIAMVQDGARSLTRGNEPTVGETLPASHGAIEFDEVHFAYQSQRPVLTGLSFRVAPGERVGIVGMTGAGKSTLVNILLGLHAPGRGRVLVDGRDITAVTGDSLRSQLAAITQDTALLNRTVGQNIALGRPHASRRDIEAAAQAACAAEFIEALVDGDGNRGYDSVVGDRGLTLSGGQRQRLAIARALLRDAPILIMDEPTSSLDAATEALVLNRLAEHTRGRTVLCISHRLDLLRDMDRILVLRDGRIAEEGSHGQLLDKKGIYAQCWLSQHPTHRAGMTLPHPFAQSLACPELTRFD